jgi:hypothetical protein
MATGKSKVNPDLEKMLSGLLKQAMAKPTGTDTDMSLTDKMKIIDRCLKLEGIKAKMEDSGYGSGFESDD